LKHFCKRYKRNKKTEKEKEKRKRKKSKRLRGHDSAWDQKKPKAQQETIPKRYPLLPPFLADWWDPLVSTRSSSSLVRKIRRRPFPPTVTPLLIPHYPCPF
jgi:hypothetical protein